MKIRTKLTLRYLFVSTLLVIFVFFILEETLFPQNGYDMLNILNVKLFIIWLISLIFLYVIGYFMARSALKPVSDIIKQMENITVSNLSRRVKIENSKDEIGELALTFNHTLDRLQNSFESQKLFISNVSHELRTPMAALIAELELSQHKERTIDNYKKVIDNALKDARKIERLSIGLLDLAKANHTIDQITIHPVRLDELLIDACRIIARVNPEYKIDMIFENESDDDKSLTINGNEYLLRTSFVNLIDNNCKFSPDKSCIVKIYIQKEEVIISFSDKGIGIPKEDIEYIYTPFYRGKNKEYSTGNGIGLAFVKQIIELHHGNITIQSAINEGTCFKVTLPHV